MTISRHHCMHTKNLARTDQTAKNLFNSKSWFPACPSRHARLGGDGRGGFLTARRAEEGHIKTLEKASRSIWERHTYVFVRLRARASGTALRLLDAKLDGQLRRWKREEDDDEVEGLLAYPARAVSAKADHHSITPQIQA